MFQGFNPKDTTTKLNTEPIHFKLQYKFSTNNKANPFQVTDSQFQLLLTTSQKVTIIAQRIKNLTPDTTITDDH